MTNLLLAIIYLSFISLGLPDAILGSAWPSMHQQLAVPLSYAGVVSMIMSIGTITSSLMSDKLTYHLGTGKVMVISVALTALALWGFSISDAFWILCLWAIPYGLGAGAVDAALNNYVAVHYASRHMSWLHCMWGVGASIGPHILGYALLQGRGWEAGYFTISMLQIGLTLMLFCSLPFWKLRKQITAEINHSAKPMSLKETLKIPGVKYGILAFFGYCGVEQTAGLWASSYFVMVKDVGLEQAAAFGSIFFIGVTVGRGVSGFLTLKFSNRQMIKLGSALILVGIAILCLPLGKYVTLASLIIIGLGCAPIFPCLIHSTPAFFGEDKSQSVIGVQMASAYIGVLLLPPIFGFIANAISIQLLPLYLLLMFAIMAYAYRNLVRETSPSP
ncbi:TPA: MFS transporter [Mannheimia haemolytica]|uniref:Multidrug resistance protein n=2 Tax=Mannheimia haemolytica TaxID=75985 RepID=A0A378NH59_MANHA|nr:MFS transporter [Mannheimia haemolytica]AGQ38461.1 MFS transporter [Mannheimia haemolytica D171]AJE07406.1 MFS transporter [Mannheimia haemolytica USDA-ARS-USMARC-184]EEY10786.1 MFS family major facilitator transporter [Mannheimia haemolytica serotype A2 str. OVINE]EEY11598.1 MFS family major facilitator transporter [Mannheimia haemolytica serotype A2 str. BOVINE]KIX31805.1 MFS transporter [Mannheimia haemolytica]